MKLSRLLFFATLLFTIAACNNDDNPNPANDDLSGTWLLTNLAYNGTVSITDFSGTTTTSTFTGVATDMNLTISFSENPNDYSTSGDYGVNLTVQSMGQSFDFQWANQGFIDNGSWEQNGDQLSVTNNDGETSTATIVTLNETTLVIDWEFQVTQLIPDNTSVYDIMGSYTFERQ